MPLHFCITQSNRICQERTARAHLRYTTNSAIKLREVTYARHTRQTLPSEHSGQTLTSEHAMQTCIYTHIITQDMPNHTHVPVHAYMHTSIYWAAKPTVKYKTVVPLKIQESTSCVWNFQTDILEQK